MWLIYDERVCGIVDVVLFGRFERWRNRDGCCEKGFDFARNFGVQIWIICGKTVCESRF